MNSQITADTPAGSPPPGVKPDFDHPPSDGAELISVASVLLTLTLLFVIARIFTKLKIVGKSSPDDFTCMFATIGAIFYYIIAILAVTVDKYGTHSWDIRLSEIIKTKSLVIGFLSNWPFFLFIMCAKLTFFLLYLQIFHPIQWLRYSSYAGVIFTVIFYVGVIIFNLVCTAPAPGESWQQVTQRRIFNDTVEATVGIACVGLVLDVVILLLPIAGVVKLRISMKRKIGVLSVFMTGTIAVIASALSIYYKKRLQIHYEDSLYYALPVFTTATAELCVGIIASCMPSMSSFLRHTVDWGRIKSILSSGSSDSSKNGSREATSNKKAKYQDLEQWRHHEARMPGYELGVREASITAVSKEDGRVFQEGEIHLQHDIEQQSQHADAS